MDTKSSDKIVILNNNDILPNRFQPRKKFSEDELLELTESIKQYGILEPIIVRPLGDKYELIAGERRYKANVLSGNDTIPVIIKDLTDAECSEIAIIENLHRENLSAIEEALAFKRAIDLGYVTQQQLAEKIGKSQSYIANKIRLLKLSDEVQEALLNKKISERHARSLLKIKDLNDQNVMLAKIINERLTVRKTDEEIDKMINENKEGQLQTTPLNAIFNDNESDQQNINNNTVFTFGPEQQKDNEPLMSFDLNGNILNEKQDDTSFNNEPQQMSTGEQQQAEPFSMFNGGINPVEQTMSQEMMPSFNNEPQQMSTGEQQQAEPFSMFNGGINPVEQPVPQEMMPSFNNELQQMSTGEQQPSQSQSEIPATPIFDNTQASETISEFKKPDPIIITDYNKQYDPVMPEETNKTPDIDFKTIINLIRQCADTIEKCGYKIDTEEYDLEGKYQVVFKIDKM